MPREFQSYFDYVEFPPVVPELKDARDSKKRPVVIVGGGPIGLTLALDLARFNIPTVVIEADDTVCQGSRAGCITRRSLDIFDQLGIAEPTMRQGLTWNEGWSFHRTKEIYRMEIPGDDRSKFPVIINIQQCYVEQYMVDKIAEAGDLIEVRWQSRVTGLEQTDEGVALTIETPDQTYEMDADWVVACDGARSFVRKSLGLRYVGKQFEDQYVIVDIKMKSELSPGRRAWFDPPSNPGATLLMHKHRDDLWRFDYQVQKGEDVDAAIEPENVFRRIQEHLDLIGETADWSPVWISTYTAKCMSLESYRHGNVLFAGDAAHLLPIFGIRGMNSGVEDVDNLAWKLAFVLQGKADEALIDTYSVERIEAMHENMRHSLKSAEFMSPPSKAFEVMRNAVLGVSERHDWIRCLVDWRTSTAIGYENSPLSYASHAETGIGGNSGPDTSFPKAGAYLQDVPLEIEGENGRHQGYLSELIGPHFTLLCFDESPALGALAQLPLPVKAVCVNSDGGEGWTSCHDPNGRAGEVLNKQINPVLLFRPDGYILAVFSAFDPKEISAAIFACQSGSH